MARSSKAKSIGICVLILTALSVSACGRTTVSRQVAAHDPFLNSKEKPLGTMSFTGPANTQANHVKLYKVRKGYALKSNITASKKSSTHAIVSKDKRKDWFAGLELKWSF